MEEIVKLRNKMKKKKPKFIGQKANIKKSLKNRYRKPKGSDSKMKQGKKGKRKKIDTGYRSPKTARGLHRTGLKVKIITNIKELIKDENTGIIISKRVGLKKKIEILKKAISEKIKILNLNPEKYVKKQEEKHQEKKKKKQKIKEKESKAKKETVKEDKGTIESKLLEQTKDKEIKTENEGKKEQWKVKKE